MLNFQFHTNSTIMKILVDLGMGHGMVIPQLGFQAMPITRDEHDLGISASLADGGFFFKMSAGLGWQNIFSYSWYLVLLKGKLLMPLEQIQVFFVKF